jgi:hypothetical protein
MSSIPVFIVFDWYQNVIAGTYSSLEKAKEFAQEYSAHCKIKGKQAKWVIIENEVDGDPTHYSNIVYDDDFENDARC